MKFNSNRIKNEKLGFTLVEVIIACAIISITTISLMSAVSKGIELSFNSLKNNQANLLLEEGAESVKSIRDAGWANISGLLLNTDYYLTFSNITNTWSLGTTATTPIDGFTRKIRFGAVNRDANDDIATSGGTQDARTKRVDVNMSWNTQEGVKTKSLSFYIADIFS